MIQKQWNRFRNVSNKLEICLVALPLILIFGLLFPYYKKFNILNLDGEQSTFGVFGDYFGGVLNPILTYITLLFLLWQWGETKRREDERDKRENQLEIESKKFQDSISIREDDRDKREAARDAKAKERDTIDLFLNKIKLLDQRIEQFNYGEASGTRALVWFANQAEKHKKNNEAAYGSNVNYQTAIIGSMAILKSLNSMLKASIEPNFFKVQSGQAAALDPKFIPLMQYELLTSHYSEDLVLHLNKIITFLFLFKDADEINRKTNYLQAITFFLKEDKRRDFPEVNELDDLGQIYIQAQVLIRNNK